MRIPVGLPRLSRWISPAGGSGVSLVYPTARKAAPFSNARSYKCKTKTGVWGHRVDFIQRRHPALGKLKLRPPADNAHPLRRGGPSCLLLEHTQRIGERRHAIPAKFHVVIQAAPDRVHVRIVKTGDHRSAVSINDFGFRAL